MGGVDAAHVLPVMGGEPHRAGRHRVRDPAAFRGAGDQRRRQRSGDAVLGPCRLQAGAIVVAWPRPAWVGQQRIPLAGEAAPAGLPGARA